MMEIKTFDTILTELCDSFDELISPKKITRTNTNIIYLMLKAVAKGFEVINNVCVVLSNKFDPATCSEEDLGSVASLVGTERLQGSATGLHIVVSNTKDVSLTLPSGTYTYKQSDDVSFSFEVLADTVITAQSYVTFIAMSDKIGQFPVTEQSEISVDTEETVPDGIKFSCTDNTNLQGKLPETDIEFRKRILEGYEGQDAIVELELALRNLPYLFDCRVRFNNTSENQTYDGITVPPYHAVIFFSGEAKEEIADIIARRMLFPTVQTNDSVTLEYHNEVLLSGVQEYYIIPFRALEFRIGVSYKINEQYIMDSSAQGEMTKALNLAFISESHDSDFITENDVYAVLNGLNLAGLTVLDVNLVQGGNAVPYINVPVSRIPKLTGITYNNVGLEE
jgi:hypothetical protein